MAARQMWYMVCGDCNHQHLYKTKDANGNQTDLEPMYGSCTRCGSSDWKKAVYEDGELHRFD